MNAKISVKFNKIALGAVASVLAPGTAALAQGAPPIFVWTGFYTGLHAGTAFSNIPNRHTYSGYGPVASWTTNTNLQQATLGVHFGYKRQFGSLVAGVETEINVRFGSANAVFSFAGVGKANGLAAAPGTITARSRVEGNLRGVFGVLVNPRTLLYGTAGVSWANFKFGGTGVLPISGAPIGPIHNQLSGTRFGPVVGAGIEIALNEHWRGRIEALHAIYGSKTASFVFSGGEETYRVRNKITTTTIRFGISRAFSTGGGPAILP